MYRFFLSGTNSYLIKLYNMFARNRKKKIERNGLSGLEYLANA